MKHKRLVVLNYCMDSSHPSLGHQFSVVEKLAENFSKIEVLTTSYSGEALPANVSVTTIPWKSGYPLSNAIQLWLAFLKICLRQSPDFVFSHMAPLNSIAVASLTRFFGIRHILWYAHAHNPKALRLAVHLVDVVVTSTKGSFPFKSSKLVLIGQGVDTNIFAEPKNSDISKFDFIYAGRMDDSKNVNLIIQVLFGLISDHPNIQLTLVGNGSSRFVTKENRSWVEAKESIKREFLPAEFKKHGTFIHAFIGSLDKVLVEAAMMQIPIISTNPEFLREFETFAPSDVQTSLEFQLENYLVMNSVEIEQVTLKNFQIATSRHELLGWVNRLTEIIAPQR